MSASGVSASDPVSGLFERNIILKDEKIQALNHRDEIPWDDTDGNRSKAMARARYIRTMLNDNPRLNLLLERGIVEKIIDRIKE